MVSVTVFTMFLLLTAVALGGSNIFKSSKGKIRYLTRDELLYANALARAIPGAHESVQKSPYTLASCVTNKVGVPCSPKPPSRPLLYMESPVPRSCEKTEGQQGSMSWVDLSLPDGKALYLSVSNAGSAHQGFFVRPTNLTNRWPGTTISANGTTASFYLGGTGQFSVEFASRDVWRDKTKSVEFDALMIFVNPPLPPPPASAIKIQPGRKVQTQLGPGKSYVFEAGVQYDWGKDQVFKVHDNTAVYFEENAYVRARIVQTEKKINNVSIIGYGTLDAHYDLSGGLGSSDATTRQIVAIYGKNIVVHGVSLIVTTPTCDTWCYCLNINSDWTPMASKNDPFDAGELIDHNPPFKFHQANCQDTNMDDSSNKDLTNCPRNSQEGAKISYTKCMNWQLGQDGFNVGKYGHLDKSFVRVNDDALKPWSANERFTDVTIWQLTWGFPIHLGWWEWDQKDADTLMDSLYVIHSHNWRTSSGYPDTKSGQCVVGGIYGSGSIKRGYKVRNVFVETACSCAVGLQISKDAYFRHPTPHGCIGSVVNMSIENMFFDEDFYQTGGYGNYLSGEGSPHSGCTGDLSGAVESMVISGVVQGDKGPRDLSAADFAYIDQHTVHNLQFRKVKPI